MIYKNQVTEGEKNQIVVVGGIKIIHSMKC